jgi:signal transduction histidine kinase
VKLTKAHLLQYLQRYRSILVWAALLVAGIIGFGTYDYFATTTETHESWRASTERVAENLAEMSRPLLLMDQLTIMQSIVTNLMSEPEIRSLSIYELKNEKMSLISSAEKDANGQITNTLSPLDPAVVHAVRSITLDGTVLGQVQVVAEGNLLQKRLNQIQFQTGIRTLLALILVGVVIRLIFQQNRIAAAGAAARAAAESANLSKTAFLANMSHELRTPMNAIIGYAELLMEEAQAEKKKSMVSDLKKIHLAARHLLNLINDLLSYTTIESGKWRQESVDFSVIELAQECMALHSYQIAGHKLKMITDAAKDVPAIVRGDATALREILKHLLANAIKFTEKGEIHLAISPSPSNRLKPNETRLQFALRDSGVGMEPEVLSRLFKVLEQGDSSATKKFGGTGLGLAICHSLILQLQGNIQVESEKGKGTTVIFTIVFDSSRPLTTTLPTSALNLS